MGTKPSDLGALPSEWHSIKFGSVTKVRQGLQIAISDRLTSRTPTSLEYITIQSINRKTQQREYVDLPSIRVTCKADDVLMTRTGNTGIVVTGVKGAFHNNFFLIDFDRNKLDSTFLVNYLRSPRVQHVLLTKAGTSTIPDLNHKDFYSIDFPLAPLPEQKKIAAILSTWDDAISANEDLLANSRLRKKALMQQLLTGKKRLPGFDGEWRTRKLQDICTCRDNLRVPLNSEERARRKGSIPYLGANGIVDFVDDFVIDQDAVLLAEDGGYFDEYQNRPIAHFSRGKAWVNNHAHILTEKSGTNLSFVYYSLVHKNILAFVNGGTRAKLNKSDMLLIPIHMPKSLEEQTAISSILTIADEEIEALEQRINNLKLQKKALMQQLLTGKKRVKVEPVTA